MYILFSLNFLFLDWKTLKNLKTKNCGILCQFEDFLGHVLLKEIKRAHCGYHKKKGLQRFYEFF